MCDSYDDKEVYRRDFCFWNSGELGRRVAAVLAPNFDAAKLKVLILRPMGARTLRNQRCHRGDPWFHPTFVRKRPGELRAEAEPERWVFHAVLEYDGWILDLDHHRPQPLRRGQFFRLRFANEFLSAGRDGAATEGRAEWPPCVVHVVPWTVYRDLHATRPSDRQAVDFDLDVLLSYPTVDPFGAWTYGGDYPPMFSSSGTAMGTAPGTR